MRFCDIDKIGIYCDTYSPSTEQRRDTEVRILTMTLRIQPLTPAIAAGIEALVRRTLFKGTSDDAALNMREATFAFDTPRQHLHLFASKDSPKASLLLDQVKIGRLRARLQKDVDGWALVFKASFGPCSRDQLAAVHEWVGTQRFVTFDVAEPDLFPVTDTDDEDDDAIGGAHAPDPTPAEDGTVVPMRRRRPRAAAAPRTTH